MKDVIYTTLTSSDGFLYGYIPERKPVEKDINCSITVEPAKKPSGSYSYII